MLDNEFKTINLINHYRNRLDDIRQWYGELSDTMTTITGYKMDLANTHPTGVHKLPGGDALAMRGPYSTGNTEPDDLPHPAQIIIEGAHTIDRLQNRTHRPYNFAEAYHRNHEALPWLYDNGHLQTWAIEINTLWHKLGHLTGHHNTPTTTNIFTNPITHYAPHIPAGTMLTLRQADRLSPGIENRVKRDRHAERTRAHKQNRTPTYRANPTGTKWNINDLRTHYAFPLEKPPKTM